MKKLIIRRDAAKHPVVFELDSLDPVKREINVWVADDPSKESKPVGMDYYLNSVPVSNEEEIELSNKYVNRFGYGSGIQLRKRMYKHTIQELQPSNIVSQNGHEHKEEAPNEQERLTAFKERLIEAISKAIRETA